MKHTLLFIKQNKPLLIVSALFIFLGFTTGQFAEMYGFVLIPSPFFSPLI